MMINSDFETTYDALRKQLAAVDFPARKSWIGADNFRARVRRPIIEGLSCFTYWEGLESKATDTNALQPADFFQAS